MKKRLFGGVLALALLLSALCPAARAEGGYCFVAVNDTIPLTLTAGNLPFYSSVGLYVPYTVFDVEPGGVVSAYNSTDQTFVLFTHEKRLIFDVVASTVTDEDKNVSTAITTYKNGVLYIPVALCASHFGLSLSVLTSRDGYMVLRFTTGSEVYDDSLFIEKAENLIAYRISQFESQPGGTTAEPTQPSAPTPGGQTTEPGTTAEPGSQTKPVLPTAYPAVVNSDCMQAAADALAAQSLRAAFFLTEAEIRANPALVRALYTAGYPLGLTVPDGTADTAEALMGANEALDELLNVKSVMVLLTQAQAGGLTGYRVFTRPDTPDALAAASSQEPYLYLITANPAAELQALADSGSPVGLLRETAPLS